MAGILGIGLVSLSFGVSVYYLLPYALLSFSLNLIMRIFISILFGMLFALTVLALNMQRILEIIFTHIFLCFEAKSMRIMVLTNLTAHRHRNKLTSIIYSLALGFIIFLLVTYKVQIQTMRLHELRFRAAYLQINCEDQNFYLQPRLVEPVLKQHQNLI